jgi:hypothetical protein
MILTTGSVDVNAEAFDFYDTNNLPMNSRWERK